MLTKERRQSPRQIFLFLADHKLPCCEASLDQMVIRTGYRSRDIRTVDFSVVLQLRIFGSNLL
jgi:hypothetical protein